MCWSSQPFLQLLGHFLWCVQGSSDPGGEQVRPGGAQQHGDRASHYEPVQRDRDLCWGEKVTGMFYFCIFSSSVHLFCSGYKPVVIIWLKEKKCLQSRSKVSISEERWKKRVFQLFYPFQNGEKNTNYRYKALICIFIDWLEKFFVSGFLIQHNLI